MVEIGYSLIAAVLSVCLGFIIMWYGVAYVIHLKEKREKKKWINYNLRQNNFHRSTPFNYEGIFRAVESMYETDIQRGSINQYYNVYANLGYLEGSDDYISVNASDSAVQGYSGSSPVTIKEEKKVNPDSRMRCLDNG